MLEAFQSNYSLFKSRSANSDDITDFLEPFGKLEEFHLIHQTKKFKMKQKGYAFVKFADLENTKAALRSSRKYKLHNHPIVFSFTRVAKNLGKGGLKERLGCWFCLDNPEADKSLLVHETAHSYLVLDKGPIDNHHFLIVPQEHLESSLHLSDECLQDMQFIEAKLQEFYKEEGKAYIRFERYFKLNKKVSHMMINYVAFPHGMYPAVFEMFELFCRTTQMNFVELNDEKGMLKQHAATGEYFIDLKFANPVEGEHKHLACILTEAMSSNLGPGFMRDFVCQVLNRPEKVNWKNCLRPKEQEEFLIHRMKKLFN